MNNIKIASNNYPIMDEIRMRWSTRSYATAPVSENIINAMLEAARWAPSAFNEQPWRFITAYKDKDNLYSTIAASLVEFNKKWTAHAPVLIVCCTLKNNSHNDKPNAYAVYDAGQAVAFLTLQAMKHNVLVHQMGGFDKDALRASLHISEAYEILTVMAVGYYDAGADIPEDMRKSEQAPRVRKAVNEISPGEDLFVK